MNRNRWLSLLVTLSVAPLGCTPTLSTQGQFVEGGGTTELAVVGNGSTLFGGLRGWIATFAVGNPIAAQGNAYSGIWLDQNAFTAAPQGSGAPLSFGGQYFDDGSDGVADRLEADVDFGAGVSHHTLLRTDAFDDYRCYPGAGACHPQLGQPSCTFTPVGNEPPSYVDYQIDAVIPFKDADGNLNGPGRLGLHLEAVDSGYGSWAPIPGVNVVNTTPYIEYSTTATGTTEGTIQFFATQLAITPGTGQVLGFGATDGSGLTSAWEEADTASAIWSVTCANTP